MVDGSMNGYIASKFFSRRQIVLVRQEHQIQRSYDSRPRNTEMTLADFASFPSPLPRANFPSRRPSKKLLLQPTRKGKPHITAFKIGPQEIAELAHNKALHFTHS
ncbi:hypothetical protein HPP92_019597 [Vanilla planifolia]|uniref:Uncharacterized protein n=1 Tax=Vanilla planifolia TaxID=51239 RepID=A0A835Q627_VANPL|nr:hypothetical protein HPP92_019597 [Vanilla planifolia]